MTEDTMRRIPRRCSHEDARNCTGAVHRIATDGANTPRRRPHNGPKSNRTPGHLAKAGADSTEHRRLRGDTPCSICRTLEREYSNDLRCDEHPQLLLVNSEIQG